MTTRHYIVTDTETGAERLVAAASQAQARHHVTKDRFKVAAASAGDVVRLMTAGVKAESAVEAPEAPDTSQEASE